MRWIGLDDESVKGGLRAIVSYIADVFYPRYGTVPYVFDEDFASSLDIELGFSIKKVVTSLFSFRIVNLKKSMAFKCKSSAYPRRNVVEGIEEA